MGAFARELQLRQHPSRRPLPWPCTAGSTRPPVPLPWLGYGTGALATECDSRQRGGLGVGVWVRRPWTQDRSDEKRRVQYNGRSGGRGEWAPDAGDDGCALNLKRREHSRVCRPGKHAVASSDRREVYLYSSSAWRDLARFGALLHQVLRISIIHIIRGVSGQESAHTHSSQSQTLMRQGVCELVPV